MKLYYLCILVIIFAALGCKRKPDVQPILQGPLISTVAGSGSGNAPVIGGSATIGSLRTQCVLVDNKGNLYVADGSSVVYKINTAGIITVFAGQISGQGYGGDNGPATAALLNVPLKLAIDRIGNLYIADVFNYRIRKVDTSGIITTVAGTGVSGFSGDGGQATTANLNEPASVVVDRNGTTYISDEFNNRIRKINTSGIISTYAGTGISGYSGDGGPATNAQLSGGWDIAADTAGNIYHLGIAAIRKINTAGIITTIAGTGISGYGGDGNMATNAQLCTGGFGGHGGLTVGATGNIFIADGANQRIRKVTTDGKITTIAGTGYRRDIGMGNYYGGYNGDGIPALTAQLNWPDDVDVDSIGNIYIADQLNLRIRKIGK